MERKIHRPKGEVRLALARMSDALGSVPLLCVSTSSTSYIEETLNISVLKASILEYTHGISILTTEFES